METNATVGIICRPDHETFGPVADRLRDRGYLVEFLDPGVALPSTTLDRLDLLVNKKIRWESLDALAYAYRNGIAAWNGYVATALFVNRLSQRAALEAAGFRTPEPLTEPPDGAYVARSFFDVRSQPCLNGEGDVYERLLDTDRVDRKYYAVNDGREVRAAVVRFRSKLFGEREYLGPAEVDDAVVERIGRLLRFAGARALGVDVVHADGRPYAVDVNPATSFRRTGLEDALADSIADAVPS